VSQAGTVPAHTQLVTRITSTMRFDRVPGQTPTPQPSSPPGTELHALSGYDPPLTNPAVPEPEKWFDDYLADPALARVRVFETTEPTAVSPVNNALRIHAWGNEQCCLQLRSEELRATQALAGRPGTHAPPWFDPYARHNNPARIWYMSLKMDFHTDAEPDNRLSFHIDQP
jgi:hypothetical protein